MNIFHPIALSLLALNLFSHPTPPVAHKTLSFVSDFYPLGAAIHVTASFPQNGGKIDGEISGACSGEINGQYTGDTKGRKLVGTAQAHCPLLFFTLRGNAFFQGTVNSADTNANVHYTGFIDDHGTSGVHDFALTLN